MILAALAGIVYGGLVWRWHRAEARFRADVALRHARGERVLAEDFQSADIPDDQNAAVYLTRAAAGLHRLDGEADDAFAAAISSRKPFSPEIAAALRKTVDENAAACDMARQARQCPQASWKIQFSTPVLQTHHLPHLEPQRKLASALRLAACYHHRTGDDAAAIEQVRDILGVARTMDHNATLISHLVAIGFRAIASDQCIRMALDLSIADAAGGAASAHRAPASRAQVRALIDDLLDEATATRGMIDGWEFERMEMQDAAVDVATKANIYTKAACYDEAVFLMNLEDGFCKAAMAPDWQSAKSQAPSAPPEDSPFPVMTATLMPALKHIAREDFRGRTERRMAATMLAMRLYAVDHGRAWPARLDQLVPAYLGSIPVDPFSPNGRAIGYLPGAKPALYSVGEDGIDGHGDQTPNHPGATNAYRHWDCADAVFRIDGDDNETPAR